MQLVVGETKSVHAVANVGFIFKREIGDHLTLHLIKVTDTF